MSQKKHKNVCSGKYNVIDKNSSFNLNFRLAGTDGKEMIIFSQKF